MNNSTINLKRRSFLKGSGALVVSALVPALAFQKSALASAPQMGPSISPVNLPSCSASTFAKV